MHCVYKTSLILSENNLDTHNIHMMPQERHQPTLYPLLMQTLFPIVFVYVIIMFSLRVCISHFSKSIFFFSICVYMFLFCIIGFLDQVFTNRYWRMLKVIFEFMLCTINMIDVLHIAVCSENFLKPASIYFNNRHSCFIGYTVMKCIN